MPASHPSPTDPVLRANPCPEVTDPICRLPLPTLFYRLEAVHLGDLLRIWVRPGTRITPSRQDFQGLAGAHRTPREARCFTGAPSLSQAEPIPGSSPPYKEKRTLPGAPASVSWFDRVAALGPSEEGPIYVSGFRNINLIPFRPLTGVIEAGRSERRSPMSQGRLTHVQLLFTWKPAPLQSSKFSFEYLLLPPRSAPEAAPPGLAPKASVPPPRPSYSSGRDLGLFAADGPV